MCWKKKPKKKIWTQNCNSFPDLPASGARLANEYCPASHPAQYLEGQEPKLICVIHEKPEPPVIPQCKYPFHEIGKLICFSGASLCVLTTRDNAYWKMAGTPEYLNILVNHGVNSLRSLSGFTDESLDWASYLPYRDEEYYPHIHEILGWIKERELTIILSLMPYNGWYDDAILRKLIQETKIYLPNIIYETANECGDLDKQKHIVDILLEEGIPEEHIQLYWVDSGAFYDYVKAHKMLSCCHLCGSEKTMDKWWINSPGCNAFMDTGMYPSDDGPDAEMASEGYKFEHPDSTKPSPPQLYNLCKYFLKRTTGFDHLSASGFQGYNTPNMELEMTLGIPEMDHMAQAYLDSKLP